MVVEVVVVVVVLLYSSGGSINSIQVQCSSIGSVGVGVGNRTVGVLRVAVYTRSSIMPGSTVRRW